MLDEKAWLAVSALIHPKKVFHRVEVSPVKFPYPKLAHPCLYGPCFVHWSKSFVGGRIVVVRLVFRGWAWPLSSIELNY